MEPITTCSSTLRKTIGKISKITTNYHQFFLNNTIRNTVIALGIQKQRIYKPYRRSRGGTIFHRIRPMSQLDSLRPKGPLFSNGVTGTLDPFRLKGPDYGNLIYVDETSVTGIKQHPESVNIMLINVQSIKSKELQLYKVLKEENIDLCVVTEMCLSNKIEDETWVKCTVLNNDNLKLTNVNQIGRKGGGIALIYCNNLKVRHLEDANWISFEYAIWGLQHKEIKMTIIAIYRPLYSTINQATIQSCFEEFTEWMTTKSNEYSIIIVLGDFNIHISNDHDVDANRFKDIIEALGLQQHASFSMHKCGNTLDHIYTELGSTVIINYCREGPILSGHTAVICGTNIQRENVIRKEVSYRKINKIDLDELSQDIKFDASYNNNSTIDELVLALDKTLKEALDKHAPEIHRIVTVRQKTPWFNQHVLEQKRIVRKRERIWKNTNSNMNGKHYQMKGKSIDPC